jgi:hypothetical protein
VNIRSSISVPRFAGRMPLSATDAAYAAQTRRHGRGRVGEAVPQDRPPPERGRGRLDEDCEAGDDHRGRRDRGDRVPELLEPSGKVPAEKIRERSGNDDRAEPDGDPQQAAVILRRVGADRGVHAADRCSAR